jgi:hypothetical protein
MAKLSPATDTNTSPRSERRDGGPDVDRREGSRGAGQDIK